MYKLNTCTRAFVRMHTSGDLLSPHGILRVIWQVLPGAGVALRQVHDETEEVTTTQMALTFPQPVVLQSAIMLLASELQPFLVGVEPVRDVLTNLTPMTFCPIENDSCWAYYLHKLSYGGEKALVQYQDHVLHLSTSMPRHMLKPVPVPVWVS